MFSKDVQHYAHEVARVLKSGGSGLITFFLLNPESESLIASGKSTEKLTYEYENGSRAGDPDGLERAVAHREDFVLDMFNRCGLEADVAERGSWCGRVAEYYQDIIRITN
jgi:hypothetical protein